MTAVEFAGVELGYTEIIHVRDHAFAKPHGGGKRALCQVCGKGRNHLVHLGQPKSMNALGSGNPMAFQAAKRMWGQRFVDLLVAAGLPRPVGYVQVTGVCCFPTRARRDQGNYRFMLEKAMGDALVEGRWLEDDDWSRYEFGNLSYAYAKDQSYTLLRLFPNDEARPLL